MIVRVREVLNQMNRHNNKNHYILFCVVLLVMSCSSNRGNKAPNDSANDSIKNVQLKAMVDSMLTPIDFNFETFNISNSSIGNDSIKNVRGTGISGKYSNLYSKVKLDVTGSYKVSSDKLDCISLKVAHPEIGNVYEVFEKYDTLLTYAMDSLTFFKKYYGDVESQYETWKKSNYKVEYAYANRTKVHFGISKSEYNSLGAEAQRNFYEGLIGLGAYELAKPIFNREKKFVGFKIMELHGKTFNYDHIYNAKLVKEEQLGYDAHECFRKIYICELYNMEFISRYDKFERRTTHSLEVFWNEYLKVYD